MTVTKAVARAQPIGVTETRAEAKAQTLPAVAKGPIDQRDPNAPAKPKETPRSHPPTPQTQKSLKQPKIDAQLAMTNLDDYKARGTILTDRWQSLSLQERKDAVAVILQKASDNKIGGSGGDIATLLFVFSQTNEKDLGPLLTEAAKNGMPIEALLAYAADNPALQKKLATAYAHELAANGAPAAKKMLDEYNKTPKSVFRDHCDRAVFPPITEHDLCMMICTNNTSGSSIPKLIYKARHTADTDVYQAAGFILTAERDAARANAGLLETFVASKKGDDATNQDLTTRANHYRAVAKGDDDAYQRLHKFTDRFFPGILKKVDE